MSPGLAACGCNETAHSHLRLLGLPQGVEHKGSGADLHLFFGCQLPLLPWCSHGHTPFLLLVDQDVRESNPTLCCEGKIWARKEGPFILSPEAQSTLLMSEYHKVSYKMTLSNPTLFSVGTQNHVIGDDVNTHTVLCPCHPSLFPIAHVHLFLWRRLPWILTYITLFLVTAKSQTRCQSELSGFRVPECKPVEGHACPLQTNCMQWVSDL